MDTILSLNSVVVAPQPEKSGAPDWIQLTPSSPFSGEDGRGPFVLDDADAVIALSMKDGRKLPIDENHATDIAAAGQPTPARGWIVELQSRGGSIWGRVEWTTSGRKLIEEREYGYISPALMHTKSTPHQIAQILRASLVNEPNLSMKSIHSKGKIMDKELRELLGLDDKADEKSIMSALRERLEEGTAVQGVMKTVTKALGLDDAASGDDVVTSLNARLVKSDDETASEGASEVEDLRNQVKSLNSKLIEVMTTSAKSTAVAVIEQAIEDLKIVPSLRDHFISRHMKNANEVEEELKLMPSLHFGGIGAHPPGDSCDGSLAPADEQVRALMGVDTDAFAKQAKVTEKEFL